MNIIYLIESIVFRRTCGDGFAYPPTSMNNSGNLQRALPTANTSGVYHFSVCLLLIFNVTPNTRNSWCYDLNILFTALMLRLILQIAGATI